MPAVPSFESELQQLTAVVCAMATETDETFVTAPSTPADRLEILIERRLGQHVDGESSRMTIFRVPAHVRDRSKDLYEPRLVSVGPYYRGREALRAMEQHKSRYMRELMARRSAAKLVDYVRAVRGVEQKARHCYSERTSIFADAAAGAQGGEVEEAQSPGAGGSGGSGCPDGGFAEMLMLDGCFILEFFVKWHRSEPDKLCDIAWGLPLLHTDLLLLENQIPFFVLETLFNVVFPHLTRYHLLTLIIDRLEFSSEEQLSTAAEALVKSDIQIHHLLHLLYEAIMLPRPSNESASASSVQDSTPSPTPTPTPTPLPSLVVQLSIRLKNAVSTRFIVIRGMPLPRWMQTTLPATVLREVVTTWFSKLMAMIQKSTPAFSKLLSRIRSSTPSPPAPTPLVPPSVSQLRDAGVQFEMKESPRDMFDITFDTHTGVMEMPRMVVDDANKALLVNLVAFEQTRDRPPPPQVQGSDGDSASGGGDGRRLSSYVALVGALVRTGKDVEHMQKRGIVENLLDGDDDAATRFFQHLGDCSSLDYKDHMFAGTFKDLREFYHSSWRRHKAKFVRDHCSSPWAVLALLAAVCAFGFALFQVVNHYLPPCSS